jgi:hypothetical protein
MVTCKNPWFLFLTEQQEMPNNRLQRMSHLRRATAEPRR